jgi:hypothetical protein
MWKDSDGEDRVWGGYEWAASYHLLFLFVGWLMVRLSEHHSNRGVARTFLENQGLLSLKLLEITISCIFARALFLRRARKYSMTDNFSDIFSTILRSR